FLITETGHRLLSERLPRDPGEIEKIMAGAAPARAKTEKGEARNVSPAETPTDGSVIRGLIENYSKPVDAADTALAAEIWLDSPDVSLIHPLGHEHGFEQVKQNVYRRLVLYNRLGRELPLHDFHIDVESDADC